MITVGELFELTMAAKEGKKIEMESVIRHHGYYESSERSTKSEVDFLSLSLDELFDKDDTDDEGLGYKYYVRFKIKDEVEYSNIGT